MLLTKMLQIKSEEREASQLLPTPLQKPVNCLLQKSSKGLDLSSTKAAPSVNGVVRKPNS